MELITIATIGIISVISGFGIGFAFGKSRDKELLRLKEITKQIEIETASQEHRAIIGALLYGFTRNQDKQQ